MAFFPAIIGQEDIGCRRLTPKKSRGYGRRGHARECGLAIRGSVAVRMKQQYRGLIRWTGGALPMQATRVILGILAFFHCSSHRDEIDANVFFRMDTPLVILAIHVKDLTLLEGLADRDDQPTARLELLE
jgi:hypothetical protein